MITTAAGRPGDQAGLGRDAAARDRRGGARRATATRSTTSRACWPCASRGRGCCARSTRRTTATSRPTSRSSARRRTSSATRRARTSDGYFWVIGRVDDVINVSGHRLSTAEVESAIVSHPKVAEAAVIGQADEDTGQSICAFVTLEGDLEGTDELVAEIREHVAQRDRQARAAEADRLVRRPAEDPLGQDHAPAAARHRRGPRARRRDHAARPGRRRASSTRSSSAGRRRARRSSRRVSHARRGVDKPPGTISRAGGDGVRSIASAGAILLVLGFAAAQPASALRVGYNEDATRLLAVPRALEHSNTQIARVSFSWP